MDYRGNGTVGSFVVWDGESYWHAGYFCTNKCAIDQGMAAAKFGQRYTWKSRK